jgi:putative acetyltransferase
LLIREEVASEREAIHKVHENAFDSPLEAKLVDLLRLRGKSSISLVAEEYGKVIGHVMFSPVDIDPPSPGWNTLGLAPIGVIPERQRQGVGKALINGGLMMCRSNGVGAVVLLGDPEYYQRFGFKRAGDFGLGNEYQAEDEFMVIELIPEFLEGIAGMVRYAAEFNEVGV